MEQDQPRGEPSRDSDGDVHMNHEVPDGHDIRATPEYQPRPTTDYIEKLITSTAVHELEAAVKIGNQLLDSLKIPLNAAVAANHPQATLWLKNIQQVQESANPGRIVVGVV